MLGYLQKRFYMDSKRMLELLDTLGIEFDGLWFTFDDIMNQCFVDRATWGLDIWEEELGLKSARTDSYEVRRARIKAKIIGYGSFTKKAAQELTNAYSRTGTSQYIPLYREYAFRTEYEFDDLISYSGMRSAFEEVKPAHLKHIIGLLSTIEFPFDLATRAKIKIHVSVDNNALSVARSRIRAMTHVLWFGKYDTIPTGLVFDGSWWLDGTWRFNGIGSDNLDWYVQASIPCKARIASKGDLPFTIGLEGTWKAQFGIQVDFGPIVSARAAIKLKSLVDFQTTVVALTRSRMHAFVSTPPLAVSSATTRSHIFLSYGHEPSAGVISKVSTFYLGVGEYDNIDPQALMFNGWDFDGSQVFDGVNDRGLDLYFELANRCAIRHRRNGQNIEVD